MRNINDCVNAFLPLLNTEYELVLGRKGSAVTIKLTFDKKDCFHLMGLQYLIDRPELNRDRGKVFDEIVGGIITTEQVQSSDFYTKIEERVHFLPLLESFLDSNDTVFKYNEKANVYSMIEADYLMKNNFDNRNLYLFLSNSENDNYYCRSFFPEGKRDYTKNQASWTLLYKKKVELITHTETVLYDRMKKITLCGDNCNECPRYNAHSSEELQKVAELWYKVGWRDEVVSNMEIACTGCSSHKECTYDLVNCTKIHNVQKCNQCLEFPCQKISSMLERSRGYQQHCKEVCSKEEYVLLEKAFFDKENNLKK